MAFFRTNVKAEIVRTNKKKKQVHNPYRKLPKQFSSDVEYCRAIECKPVNLIGELIDISDRNVGTIKPLNSRNTIRFTLHKELGDVVIGSIVVLKNCSKYIGSSVIGGSCVVLHQPEKKQNFLNMVDIPIFLDLYDFEKTNGELEKRVDLMVLSAPLTMTDPAVEAFGLIKNLMNSGKVNVCGFILAGKNGEKKEKAVTLLSRKSQPWHNQPALVDQKIMDCMQKALPHFLNGSEWAVFPIIRYEMGPQARAEAQKLFDLMYDAKRNWSLKCAVANVTISLSQCFVTAISSTRKNPTIFDKIYPDFVKEKEMVEG